jgi:hypothetical protein
MAANEHALTAVPDELSSRPIQRHCFAVAFTTYNRSDTFVDEEKL